MLPHLHYQLLLHPPLGLVLALVVESAER
eukprot:COSAG02_NODE_35397_length_469_cov_0.689189_1_plen_28_part_10